MTFKHFRLQRSGYGHILIYYFLTILVVLVDNNQTTPTVENVSNLIAPRGMCLFINTYYMLVMLLPDAFHTVFWKQYFVCLIF